jgi:ABC-2 type transport system ATP-binding protein
MAAVIECKDLKKNYAGENALAGVSFEVAPNSMFGLIGADGAGKTTLIRILTTLINADAGNAVVLGFNVSHQLYEIRAGLGYMPQRFSLYQDLSVLENLNFFADVFSVTGAPKKERIERLMQFSRLTPFKDRRAANLSGGMKQKLALSCALIHQPSLLLLDEPTTGVDPVSRNEFWRLLADIKKDGATIVVSTPYMEEASLCDQLLLLHKGRILLAGAPQALLADYPLRLFKINAQDRMISAPQNTNLPPGIALLYPAAGALHAAVKKDFIDTQNILSLIKSITPEADTIVPVQPTMEDVFFMVLTNKN